MKHLLKSINPKKLLHPKSRKPSSTLSKSPPSSFTSSSSSSSSSSFKFDVVSAFQILDNNGDGKIDINELKPIFSSSLTDQQLKDMIKEIDIDGDGCISLDELRAIGPAFNSVPHRQEEGELLAAFEFFDVDHDGRIDANELYQGFVKLGDLKASLDDCRRMIESVDVNHDGFVCFHDFMTMMDVLPR